MRSFPLEVVHGHPLVHFPDGLALVDTGCPLSIPAAEIVSRFLGRPVRRLVGTDRLRRAPVLLDYVAGRYVQSPALPAVGARVVPLESVSGYYFIPLEFQGTSTTALLDTAAWLSYADPAAVAGLAPSGVVRDFHPMLGEFDVDVYERAVTAGGREIRGHFGVLPKALRSLLASHGLGNWVLGSDFFRDRRIVLDLARNRVLDVTDVSAGTEAPATDAPTGCCAGCGDGAAPSADGRTSREKMRRAYDAAQLLVDEELTAADRDLLRGLRDHDVVIVRGSYDHVEDVLRLARIPFRLVEPRELDTLALAPSQLVIVNCPGKLSGDGMARLRAFVEAGGSLVTTDWALKHVIERAFPGFVEYNRRSTGDEVVRVEVRDASSALLAGMFAGAADPLWWLEGASYPIRVLAPDCVRVLLTSAELRERYGEAPVAVAFDVGQGEVLHMISHYYLQRAELRTARHKRSWKSYASEVGASEAADRAPSSLDDLVVGEVEAAHKSLRFMTNMVLEKQRKERRRSGQGTAGGEIP